MPTNIFNNDNYITETGFINTNIDINNKLINNNENIIYTEQNNNNNNNNSNNNNNNDNNTDIKDNDNSIDNQKLINDSTENIINKLADDLNSINVNNTKTISYPTINTNSKERTIPNDSFNKSTKRKLLISNNGNANKKINNNDHIQNFIPVKRNSNQKESNSIKKLKQSFNSPIKRSGSPIINIYSKKQKSDNLTLDNLENISTITTYSPLTYKHALSSPNNLKWKEAMAQELKNLYDNDTMSFTKYLPTGISPVSTKWVYTVKRDAFENIIKYKARLVARGFTQKKGIDYELTYSPTLNIDCLKLLLSLVSKFKWNIMQLDIKAAHLNAPLDKNIYVNMLIFLQEMSILVNDIGYYIKPYMALSNQARLWNIVFTNFLKNNNFY